MAQILGTGYQRSGKNSRVVCEGAILAFAKYEASYKGDDLDTTNFLSNGLAEGILGIVSSEWSCGGDWDANTQPFVDPPGLYPRDNLPNLTFYTNVSDATFWLYPYARVRSATNGSAVRDKVSFNASGFNQGQFFIP